MIFFPPLPPSEEEQIQKQVGEDPQQLNQGVEVILEWLKQEPHLPTDVEREVIVTFLRGCKYSLEKTKKKLDNLFAMRAAAPEFCTNRGPSSEDIKLFHSIAYILPLPGMTKEGYFVTLFGFRSGAKCNSIEINAVAKGVINNIDVSLVKKSIIAGDVLIIDAKEFTLEAILGGALVQKKKFVMFMQDAYPSKMKQIHVINVSPVLEKGVNLVMQWLGDKMKTRMYFHSADNYNDLHKHVPKDILPNEYGGTTGPLEEMIEQYKSYWNELEDFFVHLEDMKADETRRPGKPRRNNEIFGVEGSFRQLNLD